MCQTIGNFFRLGIVAGCCAALAMHFYVTFGCDFVRGSNGQKMGIWYVDDGSGTCIEWDEAMEDKYVSGSRSSLTIATVAGFGAAVLVLFEWLLCEVCCAGCIEGLAFCCAWIVGGAVFTIYGSSQCGDIENIDGQVADQINGDGSAGSCEWGADATYMAIANVLFLICGILLCCAPQPDPICKK